MEYLHYKLLDDFKFIDRLRKYANIALSEILFIPTLVTPIFEYFKGFIVSIFRFPRKNSLHSHLIHSHLQNLFKRNNF